MDTTGDEPGAHRQKEGIPLQTSITQFMTKKRKTEAHKRDSTKRKPNADTHRTRAQRAERKPDGKNDTDTESDTNMDEQPIPEDCT